MAVVLPLPKNPPTKNSFNLLTPVYVIFNESV
jgi:hypothetical protein